MPAETRRIEPADIMPIQDYTRRRKELRQARIAAKAVRRLQVGPYATILFESYGSMLAQVQEMLFIEKVDAVKRARVLATLGRIEDHVAFRIGDARVMGVPDEEADRTNAAGKTSAVHFFHFPFTPEQIAVFRTPGTQVLLEIAHPNYGHIAILSEAMRAELATDFA